MAQVSGNKAKTKMVVVGAGGCGCNQVASIARAHDPTKISMKIVGVNLDDAHFAVAFPEGDAELARWRNAPDAFQTISLGDGFGAGGDPKKASDAFNAKKTQFDAVLADANIALIFVGGGGGTGSGVVKPLADYAIKKGLLVITVLTMPFSWEGPEITDVAERVRKDLYATCPTITVYNNNLTAEQKRNKPLKAAVHYVNDVAIQPLFTHLRQLLQTPAFVNRDFNDLKTLFSHGNRAYFGFSKLPKADGPVDMKEVVEAIAKNQFQNGEDILREASAGLAWYNNLFADQIEAAQLGIREKMPKLRSLRFGSNEDDPDEKFVGLLVACPVGVSETVSVPEPGAESAPAMTLAQLDVPSASPAEPPAEVDLSAIDTRLATSSPLPNPDPVVLLAGLGGEDTTMEAFTPETPHVPPAEPAPAKKTWKEREPAHWMDKHARSRGIPLETSIGGIVTFYVEPDVAKAWEDLSRSSTSTVGDFEVLLKHFEVPRDGKTIAPKIPAQVRARARHMTLAG